MDETAFVIERRPPRILAATLARCARSHRIAVPVPGAQQSQVGVDASDAIPVAVAARSRRIAIEHEQSDIRARSKVLAEAQDAVPIGRCRAHRLGLHRESANGDARRVTGEAKPRRNRYGAARRRQPDATTEKEQQIFVRRRREIHPVIARGVTNIKNAGVLEKELALLREELAELRQVDLLLVGFDLREIRIDRQVHREMSRQSVRRIQPDRFTRRRLCAAEVTHGAPHRIRLDTQVARGAVDLQPVEGTGQRYARDSEGARNRRPVRDLVPMPDATGKVDTPSIARAQLIAERLEGNRHLDGPSIARVCGLHRPHAIPTRVHLAPFVGDLSIGASAGFIRQKEVAVRSVVECIEDNFEVVLLLFLKILANIVDDDVRHIRIVQRRADVQKVGVEEDAHFRGLARRCARARLGLHKPVRRFGRTPDRFVQQPVDRHRRTCANRVQPLERAGRHGGGAARRANDLSGRLCG